ncbi:hypothetical protein L1987_51317 [Smallanthus sonchifolius]|uniref:Uncharacterized protein n=1 Tax=Smallanthus sonchifolius TaxID=185202 RepID=A0ACB9EQ98_9ASTR|nr:hypothetical protein L1987_51317 [Smallanthus sonchifolius]
MDYRPRHEEASLEHIRESLIAISYCEPKRIADSIEPEKVNSREKAVDKVRSKLMLISSMVSDCKVADEIASMTCFLGFDEEVDSNQQHNCVGMWKRHLKPNSYLPPHDNLQPRD